MIGIISRVLVFFGGLSGLALGIGTDDLLFLGTGCAMAAFVLGDVWGRSQAWGEALSIMTSTSTASRMGAK